MIHLEITSKTDEKLLQSMAKHYTKPKGFVGRSIVMRFTTIIFIMATLLVAAALYFYLDATNTLELINQNLNIL